MKDKSIDTAPAAVGSLSPAAQRVARELEKYGTYLRVADIAEYIGVSYWTAWHMMHSKGFPLQPKRKGVRGPRVHREDFAVWWTSNASQ